MRLSQTYCQELAGYPMRLPVLEEIGGLQVKVQEEPPQKLF
jgi:hypothetical protein